MIFKWIFVLTLPTLLVILSTSLSLHPSLRLIYRWNAILSCCIRGTKVFGTWAILLPVLSFSSRQFEHFEIKWTWKQVIFRGVEGSWVPVECFSDDNDPCVHKNHTHSWQAHACASSLLLNNYSERVTLNGFNEIRRRRGDVVARTRDSNVTASSRNGPVPLNWIQGGERERLTDGKRLGLKSRTYIIIGMQSDETKPKRKKKDTFLHFCPHSYASRSGWALDQHSHLCPHHQLCHRGRPRRPWKRPLPLLLVSHAAHVHRCKEIIQLITQHKYWDMFWYQFLKFECTLIMRHCSRYIGT